MIKKIIIIFLIMMIFQIGCKQSSSTEVNDDVDYKKFDIVFMTIVNGQTHLYTIKSDGSSLKEIIQISEICYAPQWSYDGSKIAFVKENHPNYEFYIVDTSGANLQKIGEGQEFICSPFEDKICYTTQIDSVWNGVFVTWEIFLMNLDGSDKIKLTNTMYQKFNPLWSPMDSIITYTFNDNVNGTGEKVYKLNINDRSNEVLVEGYDSPTLTDWSGSGDLALFSAEHADIFKIDLNTMLISQLTQNFGGRDERAKISPNGDKIVFESNRNQNSQIYIMNIDGSNQTNISNSVDHDYFAQWSPDGTLIAYISYSNSGVIKIRIMSQDGRGNRILSETEGYDTGFDWY